MSSANLVAEIKLKLWNERALSAGEPCTCEYAALLHSFLRGTLSIHWYIAQTFCPSYLDALLRLHNTYVYEDYHKECHIHSFIYIIY